MLPSSPTAIAATQSSRRLPNCTAVTYSPYWESFARKQSLPPLMSDGRPVKGSMGAPSIMLPVV